MTRRTLTAVGLVILVLGATGCGATAGQEAAAPPVLTTDAPAPPVTTPPVTAPPVTTPPVTTPPAPLAAAPAASSWSMPDLVGSNLQEAQDAIQRLTGFGIAVTTSHDATGSGRQQVLDRNWKVCSQDVDPGEPIDTSTMIDFGAVKIEEDC